MSIAARLIYRKYRVGHWIGTYETYAQHYVSRFRCRVESSRGIESQETDKTDFECRGTFRLGYLT
jgi:hypothetical protein